MRGSSSADTNDGDKRVAEVAFDARRAGLANRFYVDDEFLRIERQRLLAPGWIAIALIDDVSEPGSIYPVTAAGEPLLLTRTHDGALHVFSQHLSTSWNRPN